MSLATLKDYGCGSVPPKLLFNSKEKLLKTQGIIRFAVFKLTLLNFNWI